MKKEYPIQYIAIGNLIDRKIIVEYTLESHSSQKNQYRQIAKETFDWLLLISITPNERNTQSKSDDTKVISEVDSSAQWSFISIVSSSYPERIGYQMLNELKRKGINDLVKNYKVGCDYSDIEEENSELKNCKDNIQLYMVELEQKYRDIGKVDIIRAIQTDVNEIKTNMRSNVDKMILNLEIVSSLEHKSDTLKQRANDFKNSTNEVLKASWWRNKRMTFAVGGIGIFAVGALIFKFIF